LVTVTAAVPAEATSAAGMVAVSWVPLTKAVVSAVPFQLMVALLLKLVPVTMSPLAPNALPVVVELGTRAAMFGMVPAAGGVVAFLL